MLTVLMSCVSMRDSNYQTTDYVPNEETAIKIAEAIWLPIYGESIYEKKPFIAVLINGKVWEVKGTLNFDQIGGVPIIEIQKNNCKIIKITHTK